MTLLRRHDDAFEFQLARRERRLLIATLELYPQLAVAHHRLSRSASGSKLADAEAHLRGILSDQQRENKKCVADFIRDHLGGGGTPPGEGPVTLKLSVAQADWLLEILNDVRVGCWVALGEPEDEGAAEVPPTPGNIRNVGAMDFAGYFQSSLLAAFEAE